MAKGVDEKMGRFRRYRYLKTPEEADEVIAWCKDPQYKVVRGTV